MPKILYKAKKFGPQSLATITQAIQILESYEAQGYDLTLRQLYYQFVSRALIKNSDREYKRLGEVVNDARMAGLIDWKHIVDRTRNLKSVSHWDNPRDIIRTSASQFRTDKWRAQNVRVEVWIEKDALVGVIEGVCRSLDVPFFSCRGYTSQSEMWSAAQRLGSYLLDEDHPKEAVVILHLGDHDPSGLDMSRDIEDRITRFLAQDAFNADLVDAAGAYRWARDRFRLDRLALNMDQIEQYEPPPNPAKLTDSRGAGYVEAHGYESWELDALEPSVIGELIEDAVVAERDEALWDQELAIEEEHRDALAVVSSRWPEVVSWLGEDE